MYGVNSDFQRRDVAIYARVSTDHEAQVSALGNQVDWYKPILSARPEWTLCAQYIDEGITGTSAEKRPQFMKMIRDARAQKFNMIITREVSRFARNTVDTLQYTRLLKDLGVEVFFINDNIKTFDGDGELRLTIMATLAQDESRKTSMRVKAGQQTSMNNGVFYGNGNILGYDRVGREMVINPEQAKTVRMIYDSANQKALTWEQYKQAIADGRSEKEFTLSTRYTAVFNAHDVEGMPALETAKHPDISQDELIRRLSEGMGVEIFTDGGDQAYYSPAQDTIHLPAPESFQSAYAFNATALHELSHSTGHPTRLNRPQSAFFGTDQYAYEELVAEMCACFMGSELQTEASAQHIDNHKAYVQAWIQAVRNKPETLVKAIRDAQAAANYMDYKAGLITDKEYEKTCGYVMEVKVKERAKER